MTSGFTIFSIIASLAILTHASTAASIEPKETVVLQRAAVPDTDRELGLGIAEFPPNAAMPRKRAAGPEVCYVLEGEVVVAIDGLAPERIHAGGSFRLPAYTNHVTSAGPTGAKIVAAWVHTPGKPFNILAAEK